MKNVKNLIAILALVSVLGVSNSYANVPTASSETTETWYGQVYAYITSYLAVKPTTGATAKGIRLSNHNETLVVDVV